MNNIQWCRNHDSQCHLHHWKPAVNLQRSEPSWLYFPGRSWSPFQVRANLIKSRGYCWNEQCLYDPVGSQRYPHLLEGRQRIQERAKWCASPLWVKSVWRVLKSKLTIVHANKGATFWTENAKTWKLGRLEPCEACAQTHLVKYV